MKEAIGVTDIKKEIEERDMKEEAMMEGREVR